MPAPCNHDALAWLERWPNWPARALVLHGPPAAARATSPGSGRRSAGARRLDPGCAGGLREAELRACVLVDVRSG